MTDLKNLLRVLSPELAGPDYVFLSFPGAVIGAHVSLEPIAAFVEAEGLTLVVPRQIADEGGLSYEAVFRLITLRVRSGLQDVGLTAAVASKLAEHGISANVIAAFHHDHLFVPADFAAAAMDALSELSA